MRRVNRVRSKAMSRRSRPNECWMNAYKAITVHGGRGLRYVEGWVNHPEIKAFQYEHGWLETVDGEQVIDVTPTFLDMFKHMTPEEAATHYVAGVRLTRQALVVAVLEQSTDQFPLGHRPKFRRQYIDARDRGMENVVPGFLDWKRKAIGNWKETNHERNADREVA